MALNILYISYDGLTDALGQSQILAYQKNISSEDFIITILSFEKEENFKTNNDWVRQLCNAAGINWIPLNYTKKPPVISTLLDLYKGWSKIKDLSKEKAFDIVHCRGYVPALLGELCKRRFNSSFIFDMRGWWPDEKLESGIWSSFLFRPVYSYFKKKEKDFFIRSNVTVSLTNSGKQEIIKSGYKSQSDIRVVPTCTDLKLFERTSEIKIKELKQQLQFPEASKVLIYSGALGGNYPVEDIFLVLNVFLQISPSHYCLILSKESLPENIVLPERTIIKSINYTEVNQYLSIGDIGLIYYTKAFSNIGRCPTKLGEYWACGLQVICPTNIGDVDSLFKLYPDSGYSVPDWNEMEIRKTLNQVLKFPLDKTVLRDAALDYFSLEKGVNFYKELYRSLSNSN